MMNRRGKAEAAFASFDFGREVDETSGWESDTGTNEWARKVYLVSGGDEPTEMVTFVVRFNSGTDIVEESHVSGW